MIPFKINKKETILIPSSWNDLSVEKVLKISKIKDEEEIIEILTGFDIKNALQLLPYFEFINEKLDFDNIEISDFVLLKDKLEEIPEIRSCSWAQKIILKNTINEAQKSENFNSYLTKIVSIYLQPILDEKEFDLKRVDFWSDEFKKESFINIFSASKNLVRQLTDLIEYENKYLKSDSTPEQKQAGVSMFDALGEWNTIDIIANGDVTKHEEVLKVDYNTILNKLYKMKLQARFEQNFRNIINKKK